MQLCSPMSLSTASPFQLRRWSPTPSLRCYSASLKTELTATTEAKTNIMKYEDAKETIRKMFNKMEASVSAYDTAWVAMVPSLDASGTPFYPATLNWILENQLHDGSWRLPHRHAVPIKDIISATLACVLALQTWQVGEQQITKGLDFIRSNFASVMDDSLHSPIGSDIIFPSMIDSATEMALNLHIDQTDLEALVSKKDLLLRSICTKNSEADNAYLAYVSEGMGKSQNWEMVMKYQRKNGSVLNSPATTAAALSHLHDPNCRAYLDTLVHQFGNAVPAVYPFDIFAKLRGIDRHFTANVTYVLDQVYRLWMQGNEEIFVDIATCAMAFRLLRSHGYNVSSEPLAAYGKDELHFNRFGGHLKDISDALEVFKASQMIIHPSESFLDEHNLRCKDFLRQILSDQSVIHSDQFHKNITQEVKDALASPYSSSLERVTVRQYIEHYNLDDTKLLKTTYCFKNLSNEVLLGVAVEDFNLCQSMYREELRQLKRWAVENRLDQLTFCRQKVGYCYFSAAATMFAPGLAEARLCWAKNAVLCTVFDDFFDVGSSAEEQDNLIKLVEEWNGKDVVVADCCSENVRILFTALQSTICEIADGAYAWQDRNVVDHIIEIWLAFIKSMWRESEMTRNQAMPTFEDYMANGLVSIALGPIVLATLYFVAPNLSNEVVRSDEYYKLYELMSISGRLLNDVQSSEREVAQGKVNAVYVYGHHHPGISNEEVVSELKLMAEAKRRQLVGLVLNDKDSGVPRACKEVFFSMSKVLQRFYMENEEYTGSDMEVLVKSILQDPIVLN